jgi:hypothetical protein
MTKPVKVIVAPAFDETGWDFPQAYIAFYHIAEKSTNSFIATEENPTYKESTEIEEVSYSANFWGSQQIKNRGLKSKPLYVLDENKELMFDADDEPDRVFSIDVSKPQYQQMIQQGGDKLDILGRIIEKHYREEVAR